MKPERLNELVTLYEGDCLEVLRTLPDGAFDAVITDPPYSSGGAFRGDRAAAPTTKYVRGNTGVTDTYTTFSGDVRDQRAYGYWCALWLDQCLRVTKSGGVCLLFTDWRQIGTTIDALQAGGWCYRGIVPWNKTEAARPAKGRFRNQCEYVVWGSNGSMGSEVAADNIRECLPGFFTQSVVSMEKLHIAAKPLEVMTGLVAICPKGGAVLDPFAGSGSTAMAAAATERRCTLIEKDAHNCDIIRKRVAAETARHSRTLFGDLTTAETPDLAFAE